MCHMSWAQDFRADFMSVYQNYHAMNYYTQEVVIRSFLQKGDTKAAHQDKGKIIKYNDKYFSSLGQQKTIIRGEHFLHVDTGEQQIIYCHTTTNQGTITQHYAILLDSMKTSNVQYIGQKNGLKTYIITSKDHLIAKTELCLDMRQKVIASICYYYAGNKGYKSDFNRTLITYVMDQTTKPTTTWFDMEPYIQIKNNNKAVLQQRYQHYTLVQPQKHVLK